MALIAMAVFDNEENQRTQYTAATLDCLAHTVNLDRHRVIVVDNASCPETKLLLKQYSALFTVITLPENIGTAEGINRAWKHRAPGEHAVKMDNDVLIHCRDWADQLEDALRRDPTIGILGLKRKDLAESPHAEHPFFRSEIRMLPHQPGERWLIVEDVIHVMGTCQIYASALLERIGYLMQPGLYGMDDSLAAARSRYAGFKNCFLHGIEIDHIDPGGTPYTQWKREHAGQHMGEFGRIATAMKNNEMPLYYDPFH